jgi:capsular exopolysaccharide synthesis family protein
VADPAASTSFVQVVRRRWPWVAVGVLAGLVGGFLWYTTKPDVFESRAQVLVIKKRTDLGPAADTRAALVEDYVATQVTFLRSEMVLRSAARGMPGGLHAPLPGADMNNPTDARVRAEYLKSMFGVTREKDPSAPNVGTNVLNLTYRGPHPDDARAVLDSLIQTYRNQLRSLYSAETVRKLGELDAAIKSWSAEIGKYEQQITDLKMQMLQITPEDPTSVRARVSQLIANERALALEKRTLGGRLKTIEAAGPDRTDRLLVLTKLGEAARDASVSKTDFSNPEAVLRQMQLERAELSEKYGDEHPLIKQADSKIRTAREMVKVLNPQAAAGPTDPLAALRTFTKFQLDSVTGQLEATQADLKSDQDKLTRTNAFQAQIEQRQSVVDDRRKRLDEARVQQNLTKQTEENGGFDAYPINEPAPGVKVEPRPVLGLMYGGVIGLFVGLAFAGLAELSDKSFRSPAEIRARLGAPVIGHVPTIRPDPRTVLPDLALDPSLVTAVRPKSVEAEAYRGVRTALAFSLRSKLKLDDDAHPHLVIQVTSPNPGDGKSTLAANLAVSLAQGGHRVALVDADMRKPRVDRLFRLKDGEKAVGLSAVIAGTADLAAAAVRTPIEGLTVVPCGVRPPNPAELLTSGRFQAVVDRLRDEYEFVILDTPPLLAVSDPAVVAPRTDGVVMVFRMTKSVRPAAERAREQLTQLGANLIGVVVNGSDRANDGYGYGYGYGYADDYHHYSDDYADEPDDAPADLPKKG